MRWRPCRHLAAPDQVSWHGPDKALTTPAGCVSGDIMATVLLWALAAVLRLHGSRRELN